MIVDTIRGTRYHVVSQVERVIVRLVVFETLSRLHLLLSSAIAHVLKFTLRVTIARVVGARGALCQPMLRLLFHFEVDGGIRTTTGLIGQCCKRCRSCRRADHISLLSILTKRFIVTIQVCHIVDDDAET